jgi:hypothetical protein
MGAPAGSEDGMSGGVGDVVPSAPSSGCGGGWPRGLTWKSGCGCGWVLMGMAGWGTLESRELVQERFRGVLGSLCGYWGVWVRRAGGWEICHWDGGVSLGGIGGYVLDVAHFADACRGGSRRSSSVPGAALGWGSSCPLRLFRYIGLYCRNASARSSNRKSRSCDSGGSIKGALGVVAALVAGCCSGYSG